MCNIEIILPTIETFLLLYSLRCGSILILVWTIFRTLFCIIFFAMAMLELLVHETSPFGAWLVKTYYQVPENLTLILFYCYLILVINESMLLVFTSFLGYGIYFFLNSIHLSSCIAILSVSLHWKGSWSARLKLKNSLVFAMIANRTGSLIIGYVSMLSAVLSLSAVSFSLYKVVTFVKTNATFPDDIHTPEEMEHVALGLYISHAYSLLIFLYYFVISLLLVIGVHKNISKYMKYYFFTGMFLLGLALVLAAMATVFLHFIATLSLLKWCVILFYCLLVVRSTYLEIEERKKPEEREMQSLYTTQQPPLFV